MVTIIDFVKRQNKEGVEFNALLLESGFELVKSKESGRYYATSRGQVLLLPSQMPNVRL